MSKYEERLQQYAEKKGLSIDQLRTELDQTMHQVGGPTFEEGIERVCYVIADAPPENTKYHRAKNILGVDTD